MPKTAISVFFLIFFLAFSFSPTIALVMERSVDLTIVYSTAEEEEKGNETKVDTKIFCSTPIFPIKSFSGNQKLLPMKYCNNPLPLRVAQLISPPPELLA